MSVASTIAPSRTVTDTEYGLPAAAPNPIVPEMIPVEVLIDNPAGNPLAANTNTSPSASDAPAST